MGLLQSSCLLPQSLWVGSVGLVIESFKTRWFTQATYLALGCFVDLLPFKRIANFHIRLTRMEEISPVFPVLLEFRCTCFLSNGYWYFAVITNGDRTCSSVITQQHLILSQCCPFCLWISFLAVCSPLTQQLVYRLTFSASSVPVSCSTGPFGNLTHFSIAWVCMSAWHLWDK